MRVDGVHRYSRLPSISIDSRREGGRKIVTGITIETLLTSIYLLFSIENLEFVFLYPFHSERDGYIILERRIENGSGEMSREMEIKHSS